MFWRLTQQQELPDHETRIKTMLIVEAMWTLMSEKLGLTDEDLYKRCLELDLMDFGASRTRHDGRSNVRADEHEARPMLFTNY